MLVTKKSKPGDSVKNTRQSRKDPNIPAANRGNQYGLLVDIHEDNEPTNHRQRTDKGKSKTMPRQASRGKHPTPPVPLQPRPPHTVATSNPSANTHLHDQNVRTRGGRTAVARGRDRGLGRGNGVNHSISPSISPTTGLMEESYLINPMRKVVKIDEQRKRDINNDKAKKWQQEEAAEAEQRVKARFDSFKEVNKAHKMVEMRSIEELDVTKTLYNYTRFQIAHRYDHLILNGNILGTSNKINKSLNIADEKAKEQQEAR
nr:hypothetical protein Iba_chr10eCG10300 [Ipomoea batatas]